MLSSESQLAWVMFAAVLSATVVLVVRDWFRHSRETVTSKEPERLTTDLPLKLRRLPGNPIIHRQMLRRKDGDNINGPSLIRVPSWVTGPLGQYYLYFGHHKGAYIRLAYADSLSGPWKIYRPGVLHLSSAEACVDHIASPDVVIDHDRREFRMYFHGPAREAEGQRTFVALSSDGLSFSASSEPLGLFYFRVFHYGHWWYALAKGGVIYRSRDGLTNFEEGPSVFRPATPRYGDLNEPGPRHVAVLRDGHVAWVYFSNIGDAPERILRARVDLPGCWRDWHAEHVEEVARPEFPWEGAALPITISKSGAARGAEHALRDPAVFSDTDGRRYLVYSVAGECGLAIAELL